MLFYVLAALLRHNFYIGGEHYVVSEKQLSIFHAYGQPWRCARNQSAHMVVGAGGWFGAASSLQLTLPSNSQQPPGTIHKMIGEYTFSPSD